MFEVDDYEHYVKVQSEAALRNLATSYAYDAHDEERKAAMVSNLTKPATYALAMGLAGGLLPALRAARLPIPSALRDL